MLIFLIENERIDNRSIISPKGFVFPDPPYPYERECVGSYYFSNVDFVEPDEEEEEESETSLPSSQSDTPPPRTEDSCHDDDDDLEPPSPVYEPIYLMPERYMYEYICSNPDTLDLYLNPHTEFLGPAGLACYNLQKGTNFQFSDGSHDIRRETDFESNARTYFVTMRNSTSVFETRVHVKRDEKDKCCLSLITTLHAPKTPEVEGDTLSLDDFFKGRMPSYFFDDSTRQNEPKFYLRRESELEEYKELFLLYAEITLLSHWESMMLVDWAKPLELVYVVVQAREPKTKMKAKAENANFYISFETRHGYAYFAVIRRTTTGKPNQMSLEFKMLTST